MLRQKIGIIALVLLAAAAAMTFFWQDNPFGDGLLAACIRIGLIMGALWLALPNLKKPGNPWLLGIGVVVLIGLAAGSHPVVKVGSIIGGIVLIALFWPRIKAAQQAGKSAPPKMRPNDSKAESQPNLPPRG